MWEIVSRCQHLISDEPVIPFTFSSQECCLEQAPVPSKMAFRNLTDTRIRSSCQYLHFTLLLLPGSHLICHVGESSERRRCIYKFGKVQYHSNFTWCMIIQRTFCSLPSMIHTAHGGTFGTSDQLRVIFCKRHRLTSLVIWDRWRNIRGTDEYLICPNCKRYLPRRS